MRSHVAGLTQKILMLLPRRARMDKAGVTESLKRTLVRTVAGGAVAGGVIGAAVAGITGGFIGFGVGVVLAGVVAGYSSVMTAGKGHSG
jgi:hypothetical protein